MRNWKLRGHDDFSTLYWWKVWQQACGPQSGCAVMISKKYAHLHYQQRVSHYCSPKFCNCSKQKYLIHRYNTRMHQITPKHEVHYTMHHWRLKGEYRKLQTHNQKQGINEGEGRKLMGMNTSLAETCFTPLEVTTRFSVSFFSMPS